MWVTGAYVDLNYPATLGYYMRVNGKSLSNPAQGNLSSAFPQIYASVSSLFPSFFTTSTAPTVFDFATAGIPGSATHPMLNGDYYNTSTSMEYFYPCVYDTGSTHYEDDGIDQDGVYGPDQGTNGIDDNANGAVDDITEMEAPPPYPVPLRGVQIRIRCFEPDSGQIREVTVIQEFVPE